MLFFGKIIQHPWTMWTTDYGFKINMCQAVSSNIHSQSGNNIYEILYNGQTQSWNPPKMHIVWCSFLWVSSSCTLAINMFRSSIAWWLWVAGLWMDIMYGRILSWKTEDLYVTTNSASGIGLRESFHFLNEPSRQVQTQYHVMICHLSWRLTSPNLKEIQVGVFEANSSYTTTHDSKYLDPTSWYWI